jgi:ribA/ribD-fused uncharacterized protein
VTCDHKMSYSYAIDDLLMCGACPQAGCTFLEEHSIQVVVNLMFEKTRPYEKTMEEIKFPIMNTFICNQDEQLDQFTDLLVAKLKSGVKIYLHCLDGHGRTGLVAVILLSKYFDIFEVNAIKMWQTSHDGACVSPCNPVQFAQIHRILSKTMKGNTIFFYSESGKKGMFGEFSNFYPAKIILGGKVYPNAEQAFQASKFLDETYRELIRQANTPFIAKILACQKTGGGYKWRTDLNAVIVFHKNRGVVIRPDWDDVRVDIMRDILSIKFAIPKLRDVLNGTDTKLLVEHTSRDSFWGDGGDCSGVNMLGQLLVSIR